MPALILIIEDEKIQAESTSIYLDRLGYATVFALPGDEGLRHAEEASPDIAIVDLRLPGTICPASTAPLKVGTASHSSVWPAGLTACR